MDQALPLDVLTWLFAASVLGGLFAFVLMVVWGITGIIDLARRIAGLLRRRTVPVDVEA